MIEDIKDGDTIILTTDYYRPEHIMETFFVDSVRGIRSYTYGPDKVGLWVSSATIGVLYVTNGEFEIIEPIGTKIEIGDTVILVASAYKEYVGRKYFVTDWSVDTKGHYATGTDECGSTISLEIDRCVILKRSGSSLSEEVCADCKGIGQIQLFTSIVKCRCCDE